MRPLIQQLQPPPTPEALIDSLLGEEGVILLRTSLFETPNSRYSYVAANPFLVLRSRGSNAELRFSTGIQTQCGNPWNLLDSLMARYELPGKMDAPYPLGGAFGFWGYDLKNFTEPKLSQHAVNDLGLPDCHVGFYDSLVVFDHCHGTANVVSTGMKDDGSRCRKRAVDRLDYWQARAQRCHGTSRQFAPFLTSAPFNLTGTVSTLTHSGFISAVERAQEYIRNGDIYQVNLSRRLSAQTGCSAWEFFQRLSAVSPAPFAAFLDCGDFQLASSSPEQFLQMRGTHIVTRPIKGTRPRHSNPAQDAQLALELKTNAKELAELLMITDLLRNDLGRVCQYGSVEVPELAQLEKFAQVQHLVSTVEGELRGDVTHFAALASMFPGGSITGAPKFRAMEIIDDLEPVTRGPYCGCLGYLGFNRDSQLSIIIRTAICMGETAHFNVGAGIVADSLPEMEYNETLQKAQGFLAALGLKSHHGTRPNTQPRS